MFGYFLLLTYYVLHPRAIDLPVRHWTQSAWRQLSSSAVPEGRGPCATDLPPRAGLLDSPSPQLRKLAEYEQVCQGRFADSHMIFSPTPTTVDEGASLGRSMARTLRQFDAVSVAPLVILEPAAPDGKLLPLVNFGLGMYDTALLSYFQSLQDNGVTSGSMGMWVSFPEANTPVWGTTSPQVYVAAVNKVASMQKQRFPDSKASLLLSSKSYPEGDTAWQRGGYRSLRPYVQGIRSGLIDSLGYQGFPWAPPANQAGLAVTEPQVFLRTDLAAAAADELQVRDIWLNTGTYGRAHVDNADAMLMVRPAERHAILQGVIGQARRLQGEGYRLRINLFAEDKSAGQEAIDWSYWPMGQATASQATTVFQQFVEHALRADIGLSIYDDDHRGTIDTPQ